MESGRSNRREGELRAEEFTPRAENSFCAIVNHPAFFQQDAQLIFHALQNELKVVSFGDYLKRYIYWKAEISQPFETVPICEYQDIIADSFHSRGVPSAFGPTTTRVRNAARNWLTQQTVSRDVVLLLGFGLRMTREDVNELLMKGLQEPRLSRSDPREMICGYCYDHGLGIYQYRELSRACRAPNEETASAFSETVSIAPPESEDELIWRVRRQMISPEQYDRDRKAVEQFRSLFQQAQAVTAALLKEEAGRRTASRHKQAQDITATDIERVFQAAIPRDHYGNLTPMKKSQLNTALRGRRLSRQRLEALLTGTAAVTRYDLMTLHFFVFSQREKGTEPKQEIFRRYIEQTNRILNSCDMGSVYIANPFECFLLLCILTEDPLGTYSDVMEQSYTEGNT